jgi:hypothetical protein
MTRSAQITCGMPRPGPVFSGVIRPGLLPVRFRDPEGGPGLFVCRGDSISGFLLLLLLLLLDIPDVFIHIIPIDRVFHPTELRKEREREGLYSRH